jgi:hypothetical protein
MQRWHLARVLALLLLLPLVPAPAAAAPWSNRSDFAANGFASQWARTDAEAVRTDRTWYWGPTPWFDYYEFYRQSPNGLRLVQYFDKARMEINDPGAGVVTNGLLVAEMVSGRQKLGDEPGDAAALVPAGVPVAGDLAPYNEGPTYAAFAGVATIDNPAVNRAPDRRGQSVGATLDSRGRVVERPDLAAQYADQTRLAEYIEATGHNIPTVLWAFLNQTGPIVGDERVQTGPVVDWLAAMGYPITEPYWIRAKVAGTDRDILVQLFERRVLTYTPSNEPAFRVEMGNVGQHYFAWRYPHLGQPWMVPGAPFHPIYFASTRTGPRWRVWNAYPDGGGGQEISGDQRAETVPYSVQGSFTTGSNHWVLVDSRRGDGAHRQLYAVAQYGGATIRLTYTDGAPPPPGSPHPRAARPANDYNPAVSPDGTKLAFVSDRGGQPHLYLMGYRPDPLGTVGDQVQLTTEPCTHQSPTWSPDGRTLVWMANCDGDFDLYQADLRYTQDTRSFTGRYFANGLAASLINVRKLTDDATDDRYPRYSPDGISIAFEGQREGASAVYLMDANGGNVRRLTSGTANESAPVWSPDGKQLVFASQRDGRWRLEIINRDGTNQRSIPSYVDQGDDRWPVWAQ